jgi:hypothetical protein
MGEARMDLWLTRADSQRALTAALTPLADLLNDTFGMIDECATRLDDLQTPFGRVSALVMIKGRNLALGCYSLSLDALAQEGAHCSGLSLRPWSF